MPLTLDQLREGLLALPEDQLQELITSLPGRLEQWPADLHSDWADELDFRMQEYEAGRMDGISLEEFKSELEKRSQTR